VHKTLNTELPKNPRPLERFLFMFYHHNLVPLYNKTYNEATLFFNQKLTPKPMKKISISPFELGSLLWIATAIFALVLAILGIFYVELVLLWLVILAVGAILAIKKKKFSFAKTEKLDIYVLSGLLCLGVLLSLITTPTIFGGRDEGSMSTAAIYITKDHGLKHSSQLVTEFFQVYGQGIALNFPGFYYTQDGALHSQFLPGYSSWVAVWYSLFGLTGIAFANLLPLVTFLFSLYLCTKRLSSGKFAPIFAIVLFALFLPVTLFFKFTLSEIFFGALVWFSLHLLLEYLADRKRVHFLLMFAPLAMAPFVRIETVGIIFMLILILIGLDFKNIRSSRYRALVIIIALSLFVSLLANTRFFVDTFRNFATISPVETLRTGEFKPISIFPDDWKHWYMLKIFYAYSIIPLLIMAGAYVVTFLRKKKWFRLVPFFFFLPTLLYLVDANISLDHPWMLRRFTFAIVPLLVLYSSLLLERTKLVYKGVAWAIAAILLLLNAVISGPLLFNSQNKDLLAQTAQLSGNFSSRDLVLVSQKSSGSNWSLISEPLRTVFGKQAVYFFNPNDLAKINREKFENIYLISSNEELELYAQLPAQEIGSYSIRSSIVRPSFDPLSRPAMEKISAEGKILKIK